MATALAPLIAVVAPLIAVLAIAPTASAAESTPEAAPPREPSAPPAARGLVDVIRAGGVPLFPGAGGSDSLLSAGEPDAKVHGEPALGGALGTSLVARDWSGTQLLSGAYVALTDQLRLSRSTRMVMMRARLEGGQIAPFVHLGIGEWRVDTELVPVLPRDTEPAAQLGGGLELHLADAWRLGAEVDYTFLYREVHEPQMISGPRLLGGFLAMRMSF